MWRSGRSSAKIEDPDPTHCCPRPISRRTTGPPWNLTLAEAAEKVGVVESGHSQVAITALAQRLVPRGIARLLSLRPKVSVFVQSLSSRQIAQGVSTKQFEVRVVELLLSLAKRLAVTYSIGCTQVAPGESFEAALHRADTALYRAKHAGRNQVAVES